MVRILISRKLERVFGKIKNGLVEKDHNGHILQMEIIIVRQFWKGKGHGKEDLWIGVD